jgi:hypothetical protein
MCEDNENPWVIAYRITNLFVDEITTDIRGESINTSDLFVKLYRQSSSSLNMDINSNDNDRITVDLYSLSGQKVQTLFNNQPIQTGTSTLSADCSLPTGVYVVKTKTSQGLKSSLVRL